LGGGSGVGGGATSGGEPTGVASVAAVGASAATAGRRAGAPGGRLRTFPYTNPAIASRVITTAVVMMRVCTGSEVGRIFSMSTAAATRREPRGAGPASVVVGTAVVAAAGLVVVGAGRVVEVAAAPLVVATAVVVGDAPAPSYIATQASTAIATVDTASTASVTVGTARL
jgi:hypothetical protein